MGSKLNENNEHNYYGSGLCRETAAHAHEAHAVLLFNLTILQT